MKQKEITVKRKNGTEQIHKGGLIMALLEFHNVTYAPQGKRLLHSCTVTIESGDFWVLTGPSGTGKSTFLKLCCHLLSPTAGTILYDRKDLFHYSPTELRRQISYVAQTPVLFGQTVYDNFRFVGDVLKTSISKSEIETWFGRFALNPSLLHKPIGTLSGGEKQRLALIRTLLLQPPVLLLDEITAALDYDNSLRVEKVIQELRQAGTTILWISHDLDQQRRLSPSHLIFHNQQISQEVLQCIP